MIDTSARRLPTKYLWLAATIGGIFVVLSGIAYLKLGGNDRYRFLLEECFKTSLTFTFIAIGGALVKAILDAEGDRRAELKAEFDAWDERRRTLVRELTDVFSGFYTVRKHYHSALSAGNDTGALPAVRQALLREAVALEGRYGGFKVQALIHLNLPLGDLKHKNLSALEEQIRNEKHPDRLKRLWFDFVGEAFDGWRHGLEGGVEIETVDEAWRGYKHILELLMRARLDRKTESGVAE